MSVCSERAVVSKSRVIPGGIAVGFFSSVHTRLSKHFSPYKTFTWENGREVMRTAERWARQGDLEVGSGRDLSSSPRSLAVVR